MRNGGREKERIESIGNLEERIDKRKVEGLGLGLSGLV